MISPLPLINNPMTNNDTTPDRAAVIKAVEALFGDPAEAERWLTTLNPDLGAIPMDCLDTAAGRDQVMATLGRIEHGVFD